MKKRMIKTFALACCACLTLNFFASCNIQGNSASTNDGGDIVQTTTKEDLYTGGTHIFDVKDTEKDMIKNGECDYQIVYPSSCTSNEEFAVQEFIELFAMATNIELEAKRDVGLTHNASAKYISIGNTSLLNSSGIDTDVSDLKDDGCKIVTKDNTVYIFGGKNGVMYGVYDFMQITFNYEIYYIDCIEIDKNVRNLKLKNYNVKDIPDVEIRHRNWDRFSGSTAEDARNRNRFRTISSRIDQILPIHQVMGDKTSAGGGGESRTHNSTSYFLPPDQYQAEHPKWYASSGNDQLCWSAHGDQKELQAMIETAAEKIIWSLQWYTPTAYPDCNTVLFSIEDAMRECQCDTCTMYKTEYCGLAAPSIIVMNGISEIVDEWMAREENAEYRRDLTYCFLAYLGFEAPPVKYDETLKKYVPIDESVTPRDNVKPYLAMMMSFDYQLSLQDEMNKKGKDIIDQWTDITGKLNYWLYSVNYRNLLTVYDSFNFFNDAYRFLGNQGIREIYVQGGTAGGQTTPTAWGSLKLYIESKMLWDVNLDADVLTENWFKAMFKEAAPEMKELFQEERLWNGYLMDTFDLWMIRSNYTDLVNTKYFPMATLENWMAKCDSALAKVEKYKTSAPELYQAIKNHIEIEWITPSYLLLALYNENLSSTDKNAIIDRFVDATDRLGILRAAENRSTPTITDFIATIS